MQNSHLAQPSIYALVTPTSNNPVNEHLVNPPQLKPNGRVPVSADETFHPYKFADKGDILKSPVSHLANMQESTLLSKTFFLPQNVNILQNALRRQVYNRTNNIIQEQSTDQLQIVMRSIFLQYSTNRTDSAEIITEQVAQMNEHVLNYCVPIVASNLRQYEQYRKDISQLPVPIEHGLSTSIAGSKSYKQGPFI